MMINILTKQAEGAFKHANIMMHNAARALEGKEMLVGEVQVLKQMGDDLEVVWRTQLTAGGDGYANDLFCAGKAYGRAHLETPRWVMVVSPLEFGGQEAFGVIGQSWRGENVMVVRPVEEFVDDRLRLQQRLGSDRMDIDVTQYHAPLTRFWDGFEDA